MEKIPACIGVIMDGNRRWAKARGVPTLEGHRAGFERVRELLQWMREAGVKHVILYAFSTENWNRSAEEVSYLMELLREVFKKELRNMAREDVRIRVVGDRARFDADMQSLFAEVEAATATHEGHTLAIALSYGGRAELVHAYNALLREGKQEVTEGDIAAHVWTADIPDPDMIIRTSGEQRLSNFLPWQSVYSELFFTKTLWPDFSKEEFFAMLEQYAARERRNGT